MAILRALGGGGILENNIVQTGASAGSSIASGVIFTVPALVILGYWTDFRYSWVLAIAGLGGILGVLFSVPLRSSLIVDQQMAFPEGKAAAEVLQGRRKPCAGREDSRAVGAGGRSRQAQRRERPAHHSRQRAAAAGFFGKYLGYIGTNLSPALLGVGYIVGLNIGIVVLAGSVISWNIAIPIFQAFYLDQNPELAAAIAGACQGLASHECAETTAGMLWSRADSLSRRRRHAGRRPVGAGHSAQIDHLRRQERARGHARQRRRAWSRTPTRTCR